MARHGEQLTPFTREPVQAAVVGGDPACVEFERTDWAIHPATRFTFAG